MEFPISGVEVSPLVPILVGFTIASCTTPTGVSGAFLLLPFQFSVLNFTSAGVTPTNLLFNVISTPGAILSYRAIGSIDWTLVRYMFRGAGPGVIVGALLRITVFESPGAFRPFAGVVLLALGINIAVQTLLIRDRAGWKLTGIPTPTWITTLGAGAGVVGGIYGISGGSVVAPVLVGIFGMTVKRTAPAALISTFLTSVTGLATFEILRLVTERPSDGPDWFLGLLFAVGGAAGGFVGSRINARGSDKWLRLLLGMIALAVGVSYLIT